MGDGHSEVWEKIFNLKPDGNFSDEAGGQKTGANILHLEKHLSQWAQELKLAEGELDAQWAKNPQKIVSSPQGSDSSAKRR